MIKHGKGNEENEIPKRGMEYKIESRRSVGQLRHQR